MSSLKQKLKKSDVLLCIALLLAGLAITLVVFSMVSYSRQKIVQAAFELEVDERFSRLQRRFTIQESKLENVTRFYLNADEVTDKEFQGFVSPLVDEGETYGWVQQLDEADLDAFKQRALESGAGSTFSYYEIDSDSGLKVPLKQRPEHFILRFLLTRDGSKLVPGLELSSRPGRVELLQRARRTRQMVVSDPLTMSNGEAGIFFVSPAFQQLPDSAAGNDDLVGYAVATVRVSFLMEQNIPLNSLQRFQVTLSNSQHDGKMIYQNNMVAGASDLLAQRSLKVADRQFQLTFRPTEQFLSGNANNLVSYVILISGAGLTLLITFVVYLQISQRMRAMALVAQRTEELRVLSITDHLTGAFNRRYFEQSMVRLVPELQGTPAAVSVILFDIDHFKMINDTFGHDTGDQVLVSLCQRVLSVTRKTDILCRTGGEEFTLICPDTTLADAQALAENLKVVISSSPLINDVYVTCSFGVTLMMPSERLDGLIRRVDQAMYRAKTNGRNQVILA